MFGLVTYASCCFNILMGWPIGEVMRPLILCFQEAIIPGVDNWKVLVAAAAPFFMMINQRFAVCPRDFYSPVAYMSLMRWGIFLFLGLRCLSRVASVLGLFWQTTVSFKVFSFSFSVTTFRSAFWRFPRGISSVPESERSTVIHHRCYSCL